MELALVLKSFQKCMSRILEGVECNIDDVLVHVPTIELHDYRLQKVLECLSEAGLTLNIDRCTFRVPKIKFLGNVVSANCTEVDSDKVPTCTQECSRSPCVFRNGKPPKQVCRIFSRQDQTNPFARENSI